MERWGRLLVVAAAGVALATAPPARGQAIEVGHTAECLEAAPSAFAVPVGPAIELHVHVVLDGVPLDEGRAVMESLEAAYEPMGITVVPSFATATIVATDSSEMIAELKSLFGGVRPPWAHVVYLISADQIDGAVAGQADCIGGVAFEDSAFAVGEHIGESAEIGPVTLFGDLTAKIAAHEVGHLLGAHHHYANCAEGVSDQPTEVSPCTLMFNDISLISLRFSTMNSSVVRGHVDVYTEPVTAAPPPDGSPVQAPQLSACDIRAYRDRAGDQAFLKVNNPDDADLLAGSFHTSLEDGREVVRFRWKLSSLDGEFSPGARAVRWWLDIKEPQAVKIEARWDGQGPPTASVVEGPPAGTALPVTLTPGTGGIVEVELPLAGLGLAGQELALGLISGLTDVDSTIDYDIAQPLHARIRPGLCPAGDVVASGQTSSPQPQGSRARPRADHRLELLTRSAQRANRRGRLTARISGSLRDVRVRLADARGRTVARGRVAKIDGRATVTLRRSKRRLRPGAHVLHLTARSAAGRPVRDRLAVRLRR